MLGTQIQGHRSMVIRVDKALYDRLVEWAQIEQIPLTAAADAALWSFFTQGVKIEAVRQQALNTARMARGARREKLLAKVKRRPRWLKPPEQPKPRPVPIPTVGLMPTPSMNLPME